MVKPDVPFFHFFIHEYVNAGISAKNIFKFFNGPKVCSLKVVRILKAFKAIQIAGQLESLLSYLI